MDYHPDDDSSEGGGISLTTVGIGVVVSFVLIYLVIFLIGLIAAIAFGGSAASFFAYFRDLLTIALSMTTMVIFVGIGIMIIQIARFVNLLRSEIKPITEDTRRAVQQVRSTTEFVQKHALEPIIRTQSFLAGLIAFLREIVRISRMLQKQQPAAEDPEQVS